MPHWAVVSVKSGGQFLLDVVYWMRSSATDKCSLWDIMKAELLWHHYLEKKNEGWCKWHESQMYIHRTREAETWNNPLVFYFLVLIVHSSLLHTHTPALTANININLMRLLLTKPSSVHEQSVWLYTGVDLPHRAAMLPLKSSLNLKTQLFTISRWHLLFS